MLPTLAGLPTYPLFQAASVVAFLLLACYSLRSGRPESTWRRMRASKRQLDAKCATVSMGDTGRPTVTHSLGLTVVYVLCNFLVAKLLYDVRSGAATLDWLNYLRPRHYFAGGYWGWPA